MIEDWSKVIYESLKALGSDFLEFIPNIIGALIAIIIGWFVAVIVGKIATEVLRRIKFNKLFEKGVWKEALSKAKWKVDPSGFIGAIVKWVLFITFLTAAVDILGFDQFADFVVGIANWLPNVIIAAAIFVVAVIVSEYVPKIIRAAAEGIKIKYGHLLEEISRIAIWIFAVLAILVQLDILGQIPMALLNGFIYFLVIAGGLAFGLGGKDVVAEFLQDIKKKMEQE